MHLVLTQLPTGLYRLTHRNTHLSTFALSETENPTDIQLSVEVGRILVGLGVTRLVETLDICRSH